MTPVCWALTRSRVQLPAAPQTAARQAPLSVGFSSKNTEVDCRALLHGIILTQGSNLYLLSPALAGRFFTASTTLEARRS